MTQQGVPVADDQNMVRVGDRGPAALEDFHFREKVFHFDHERIPERVVIARGYGGHGYFENYASLAGITRADIFQRARERTPAFVRFSTVASSKGSSDLDRDVHGFAVKLYTREGNWDIDRAILRSLRFMKGFGVHTFRFIDADGKWKYVKFHWKPAQGPQSVTWDEAVTINGADPDFHRRDLWDSIETGEFPSMMPAPPFGTTSAARSPLNAPASK